MKSKVVLLVALLLVFSGCSSTTPVSSTRVIEENAESNTSKTVTPNEEAEPANLADTVEDNQEVGFIASYDDQIMEILGGSINEDTLTVRVRFINNASDGLYAYESFACIAYQDGMELEEATDINDDDKGAALIRRVKDGAAVEAEYKYIVSSDSDIEFFICAPTVEEEVLAKKVFSFSALVSSTEVIEEGTEADTGKTVSLNEEAEPAYSANIVKDKDLEVGLIAVYDDQVMEILDGSIREDTLVVRVRFTDNSSDGFYAYESFACIAYQDGMELEEVTDINDDEMGAALIREVKNGTSIEGEYKFSISSDSDIEFLICAPTVEEDILAKRVFTQ